MRFKPTQDSGESIDVKFDVDILGSVEDSK